MCSNHEAVSRADRLLSFFGVARDRDDPTATVFPTGIAPFIRLAEDGSGHRRVHDGAFGLLPYFAKELAYGRRTYNALGTLLTINTEQSFCYQRLAGANCFSSFTCSSGRFSVLHDALLCNRLVLGIP